MGFPQKSAMKRPCPDCGGQLLRKTEDQAKPLGMVCCSKCQFKSPIDVYVGNVQAEIIAQADQRKAQG